MWACVKHDASGYSGECPGCKLERERPSLLVRTLHYEVDQAEVADAFGRGYDQAVQEVLDEVQESDPDLVRRIVSKYPLWGTIWERRMPR